MAVEDLNGGEEMREKKRRENRGEEKKVWAENRAEQRWTEENELEQSRAEASTCIKADQGQIKGGTTGQERTEENMTEGRGSWAEQIAAQDPAAKTTAQLRRREQRTADRSSNTTEQNRGIVFWDNSSCQKRHCYLKAVSSGETNAKPQKGTNTQTGVEMTSKEFIGTDNKALLP